MSCDLSLVHAVALINRWHKMQMIWLYFTINDDNQSKTDWKRQQRLMNHLKHNTHCEQHSSHKYFNTDY